MKKERFWGSKTADEGQRGFLASYGRIMPAFMYPEHHPDYVPYKRPKLRQSAGCPGSQPFDWRKTCKPYTLAEHAARLKGLPRAETWTGNYPDAPPAGQECQTARMAA